MQNYFTMAFFLHGGSIIYDLYFEFLNEETHIEMIDPIFDGWHPWFVDIYCPSEEYRKDLFFFLN